MSGDDTSSRAQAVVEGGPPDPVADAPMWLSHHWPGQYDRCAVVRGRHVCRRCLVLYPLALVTGIAVGVGSWWPHYLDAWVLWLFPLPGVVDFVADNVGAASYSPRRQMVLSAFGAVAAGIGYLRYLDHAVDALVWSVVAVYTSTCVAGVMVGIWRNRSSS